MSAIFAVHAQRPFDIPSVLPQAKSPDQRYSTSPRDAADALLMSLLLANLNVDAFAPRNAAPLQINAIVLVDHAGRLSAAVVVLWRPRDPEPEPTGHDDRQSERARQQHHRPEPAHSARAAHRAEPTYDAPPPPPRAEPADEAPPPPRPTASANPYAPDGWSYDRLPHEILGLSPGETDVATIGKAFRAASLKAHPDKGGSQAAMQAVAAAREFMQAQAEQGTAGSANQ